MGKITDLDLNEGGEEEEEGKEAREGAPPDLSPRAQELVDTIDEMLSDGRWGFAENTLKGIFDTVRGSGRITLGQRRAVENIYNSKLERYEDEIRWRY